MEDSVPHLASTRKALAVAASLFVLACSGGEEVASTGLSAGNSNSGASTGTDTDGTTGDTTVNETSTSNGPTSSNSTTSPTTDSTTNPTSSTSAPTTDPTDTDGCIDNDGDQYGEGCALGADCDDNDFNNFTPEGCANCMDGDADDIWAGCDQYDDNKQGPDCDDANNSVGLGDAIELCNGLAENCAGEVDPLPPEQMCPPGGDMIAGVTAWACNPPMPGQDGCQIASCDAQLFDINADYNDGCECVGTDRTKSMDVCGDVAGAKLGTLAEGAINGSTPKGVIPEVDNGVGNGAEDWFWAEFPEAMATGKRPNAGIIKVTFAKNDNQDYRFEVYRACNAAAFADGLATQFGAGAPPALEWWFQDNNTNNAKYSSQVAWPEKVYIRVFRVQNANTCSEYQLKLERAAN